MYRLALISIESGACVANPIYKTDQECYDQLDAMKKLSGSVHFDEDEEGRRYVVPARPNDFIIVIEPVHVEEVL